MDGSPLPPCSSRVLGVPLHRHHCTPPPLSGREGGGQPRLQISACPGALEKPEFPSRAPQG